MRHENLVESHVTAIQEAAPIPGLKGTDNLNGRKSQHLEEKGHQIPLVCPYQPPVPYSRMVALSKILKLEPRFVKSLEVLRKLYVNVPFLGAIKEAPAYLKLLRELLSKKGKLEEVIVVHIGEVCIVIDKPLF